MAAGVAFAPGRLAIALPVQEQGAKNILFFCKLLHLSVTQHQFRWIPLALNCYAMAESHQTRALPPVCPWRLEIVRSVLLGTHDQSTRGNIVQIVSCGQTQPSTSGDVDSLPKRLSTRPHSTTD